MKKVQKKEFCLYHDACMRPEREIREVIEAFEIFDVKMELLRDGHYKCEGCNPNYLD